MDVPIISENCIVTVVVRIICGVIFAMKSFISVIKKHTFGVCFFISPLERFSKRVRYMCCMQQTEAPAYDPYMPTPAWAGLRGL